MINAPQFVERAEILREKGTDRSRFFRGQIDRYTWVDYGSSYLPADPLAAVLYGQLEHWSTVQARRLTLWSRYRSALSGWAAGNDVSLPTVPPHCGPAHHLFYLLLPSLEARQALIARLRERGILAVFHYLPLHLSEMGRLFGGRPGDCPVTEDISERLLRLPLFNTLTDHEQDEVIETVIEGPL